MPERGLVDEADALVQAARGRVRGVDVEPDPLESQLVEPEVEEHPEGIGAVTLRSVGWIPDLDAQTRAAVREVDRVEVERADGAAVPEEADHEVPAVAAVMLEEVVEPLLLEGNAQRTPDGEVPGHARVRQPPNEQRDVRSLGGSQVDE